jgi:hypothetical protein
MEDVDAGQLICGCPIAIHRPRIAVPFRQSSNDICAPRFIAIFILLSIQQSASQSPYAAFVYSECAPFVQ